MRLLFVSPTDLSLPCGGRAMLARLHRDSLHHILGDGFAEHRLLTEEPVSAWQRLQGHIDGATAAGALATIAALDTHGSDAVWFDGGNLGRLAQAVRAIRPRTRILTFCHNVEARFFFGALRRSRGVKAAGVLVGNIIAERLAMRYSSDVIALSDRDSAGLRRLYGRGADHILPMALTDRLDMVSAATPLTHDAPLLFVGGSFYANQAGIAWFAAQVAPRIGIMTQVVGQGMEAMRGTLERTPNVRVLGAVDRLAPLYRSARLVVAPILDGSGMKTKVAEALMYGKHVAGTPEAFSGYADDVVAANWCCADADAFVSAIERAVERPPPGWDPAIRALYERDHSPAAARRRLARILDVSKSD